MKRLDNPSDIEEASFLIIQEEIGELDNRTRLEQAVIYRMIHTTADFSFAESVRFNKDSAEKGRAALLAGCNIVTDTTMSLAGMNKQKITEHGGKIICLVSDPEVIREAKERNTTRSIVAMEHAVQQYPNAIFSIGNAPTALLRLIELVLEGKANPALIIGVPVGFVNVEESKESLLMTEVPYIVTKGRKGGSTVATAIINALLYGEDTPGMRAL